ncbi:MAG TPA: protease complex subunit PrcB family protein [Planctomycetota bacterium]|nr:protease complex subunit PrcB family protein [Planctomycetota bacterium]
MAEAAWVLLEILRAFSWETHTQPGQFVFRTKAEMLQMWQADGGKEDRMPKVDFEKESVIAVFAGEKSGTGHKIRVELIVAAKDDKSGFVVYKEYPPGADSRAAQKSYPNHIVVVKKTAATFKFLSADSAEGKQLLEASKKPAK